MRVLNDADLLDKLKHLARTKSSDRTTPTRAPPHVCQLKIIRLTRKDTNGLSSNFSKHTVKMIDDMRLAIESNDVRSGELSLNTLEASLCIGALRSVLKLHAG